MSRNNTFQASERHSDALQGDPDENTENTKCGLGTWKPKWLQKLESKKLFIIIYGLLGMNETAIGTYFVGTISTVEKRFKLPSVASGMLSSIWDIGSILALLVVGYYGGTGNKTRWVSRCSMLAALGCFFIYLPHLIFGPGDVQKIRKGNSNVSSLDFETLCSDPNPLEENCFLNPEGTIAFSILVCGYLLFGIGMSSYWSLGAAYLDDNVRKDKFPFLIGLVTSVRYTGPTIGYLISSYMLSHYIDSDVTPDFAQDDPRWIGAWQKAWIPFGLVEIMFALGIGFFPRMLPREAERRKVFTIESKSPEKKSFRDFKETINRLLKNKILMFNTFSSTFYAFGLMGNWLFLPKYIETQFRQSSSTASLITGCIGLTCMALGLILSSAFISKIKPKPKSLAAWNVFTETIDVIGHISLAYIGCLAEDIHGSYNEEGRWNLTQSCNSNCSCHPSIQYSPVCSYDQKTTFYSPCHAGCLSSSIINGTKTFTNCSCIGGLSTATNGPCPIDCNTNFYTFLAIVCVMQFLSSSGRTGNTIIQYRSVHPDDKSISIGFSNAVIALLCFAPAPVFFGMLLDSSCMIWGVTCGKTGNCWLYHGKELRFLLNFTSAGFYFIATLLDIVVFCSVGSLNIYDEPTQLTKESIVGPTENQIPLLNEEKISLNQLVTGNSKN